MPKKEFEPNFDAPLEEESRDLIEDKKDKLVVMGIEIPKNPEPGVRTPRGEKFENFGEDEFSLDLLQKIAKGVSLDQPTMLEGGAAVGKSSSIEYLAHLTNNEVYRLSLNGQTDTTDLIGKWVPRTEDSREKIDLLFRTPQKCKNPEARNLIESIKIKEVKEGENNPDKYNDNPKLGLTREETMRIAELEGIIVTDADWVWQDGEVPRQIINGAWTVLDEVNTCEPQILVRLNALLEKNGELSLHEDGERIPKPKDPKKKHMLFATVNPPGGRYKGRVPLSAEWISRWNYQNIGDIPQETAIFRAKKKNGCKVSLPENMQEKIISPKPIEKEMTLADVFGEEWTSDLCEKYITAFYKVAELVHKEQIARDQEQKFDYDQRDWQRFEEYVRAFRETGNMKKVIEDAVEYVILGKLKNPQDRQKIKDIVLGLIKIQEPKEQIPQDEKEKKKMIKRMQTEILSSSIPQSHKELLMKE